MDRLWRGPAGKSERYTSGDALVAFDEEMCVVGWNAEAERLTGIPAAQALGRPCWELLAGVDEEGDIVCHRGCSCARQARCGWPVGCQGLLIRAPGGRRRVTVSTIAIEHGGERVYLHAMRAGEPAEAAAPEEAPCEPLHLTARQLEVLELLAVGVPAKLIARRLDVAEATVRSHIRAILRELDSHSQIEAIAQARRLMLV